MSPVHFDVQLSHLVEGLDYNGKAHTTRRNEQLDVITDTAQRAIELALERFPGGDVHVVQRRGTAKLVLDPLVVVAPADHAKVKELFEAASDVLPMLRQGELHTDRLAAALRAFGFVTPGVVPPAYVLDQRPHSRACGWRTHPHGPDCARDCPTCALGR